MSVEYSTEIWKTTLPPSSKLVILALADFANNKGEAWPSIRALSVRVGVSERSIQRILRSLQEGGFITIDESRGRGNCNVYRLSKSLPTAIGKGDMPEEKGDTDATFFEPKGDTDDTFSGLKGDMGDTFSPAEKVTPVSQKVTWVSRKGDMGVTRSVMNHQEPSGSSSFEKPRRRVKPELIPLTLAERDKLLADFAHIPECNEEIDRALAHEAHLKYPTGQYLYVRGWLRRTGGTPNGRANPSRRPTGASRSQQGTSLDARWEQYQKAR